MEVGGVWYATSITRWNSIACFLAVDDMIHIRVLQPSMVEYGGRMMNEQGGTPARLLPNGCLPGRVLVN